MKEVLQKIWDLFRPAEKRKAVAMLALAVSMAITEVLGVLSIMPFLSVLSRPEVIHEQPLLRMIYGQLDFNGDREFIIGLGLASIAMVLVSSAFKTIGQYLLSRFVHLQRYSLSSRLLSTYLRQPYEFFLYRNSAELSKNILSEVDQIINHFLQPLSQLIAQCVIVLAMLLLMIIYEPLIALVILIVVGGLYVSIYRLVRTRLRVMGKEMIAINRDRYQACNEIFGGIRDIKISHSAKTYQNRYNYAARTLARHQAGNDIISQAPLFIVEAVGFTGIIILALSLVFRSSDITQVLPVLGMYAFAAYRMLPAAQVMYRSFAKLRFASAVLDSIHKDLCLPTSPHTATRHTIVPTEKIRLENVTFAYPNDANRIVFEQYNIEIAAKETTVFVGKSGSGKSTLMDILLGLIVPQSGTLWIDGIEINLSNVEAWHNAIGYVPQHIYLADASITKNIAFGIPDEEIDGTAVERAAKIAQIHDFILNELPQGYDTSIGERGVRLSGGQRQRIGIARALYKDPDVLFMDEATSALDYETEASIYDAIYTLMKHKTIIIITHRIESIKKPHTRLNVIG